MTTTADCAAVVLERHADYAGQARAAVSDACRGLGRDVVEIAQLLTSELVANAINCGSGFIYLEVARSSDRVRVSVDDESPEVPRFPRPGVIGPNARGLMLVEYLAARWGVIASAMGKRVWFELRTA